ncbi:MAG: hypothetical protein HIU81_14395 [Acidobacteria bacterium]|nr:hypothetical protein [Acidobacteriota bacterium]
MMKSLRPRDRFERVTFPVFGIATISLTAADASIAVGNVQSTSASSNVSAVSA